MLGDEGDETPTTEGYVPFDGLDNVDTDPSMLEWAPHGRSASGLPLDGDGQECDMVTSDGFGFNDSDGPAQMRTPKGTFKDDWGPWGSERELNHFFEVGAALETAKQKGEAVFDVALTSYRLRNLNQWQRVRFTFFRHFRASDARFEAMATEFQPLL